MSKIFEALQRTPQVLPELDAPLLTPDAAAAPVEEEEDSPVLAPAALPVEPAPAHQTPQTVVMPPMREPGGVIRTQALHLKAADAVLPFDARSRRSVEQYRVIRTRISHHAGSPRMIVVTSAGPGDGKTITSINITGAMSLRAGVRVLLVDGDLRRSSVARMLGISQSPGLTDVITQKCDLNDAVVRLEQFPNYYVLPAGTPSANPPELLDSQNWHTLCATLRAEYSYVIFDAPPVAAVADYDLIQSVCDGVLMVARPNHTSRSGFKKALSAIPQPKVIGVVLNDVEDWFLWNMQSGHSYAYYDALDMSQMKTPEGNKPEASRR